MAGFGQVHRVDEMSSPQIEALPRDRTAVILVGGILEEHGPYLPAGTDTFMNEWWARRLAEAIVARPGWHVLLFPTIPLATSPANVLGGRHAFAGSYAVRPSTERAVFMDLASRIGEQGFRWIFVVHNHGSPLHNLMLDQAGDYFHDQYGGSMVNLPGLLYEPGPEPRSAQTMAEEGQFEVHAGMSETSRILFLRPDLVSSGVASAAVLTANSPADAVKIAREPTWPGYIGSPRLASAAYGAQHMNERGDRFIRTALAILDGRDASTLRRISQVAFSNKDVAAVEAKTVEHEEALERQQREWMARKGIR
jgi:creatinine amidohydrolase/Fe(II)-dependent formamide hydrolase-like protein